MHHHPETDTVLRNDVEIARLIQKGLPKDPSAELLASYGVYPVEDIRPEITSFQKATRSESPVFDETAGVSRYVYTIEDKTPEELLASAPWQNLDQAQIALAQWINKLTFQIEGKYPEVIQKAWKEEEEAALAFKLGNATEDQTEMLTRLGAKKNRTADEQADRVLWLAGTYRAIKDDVHDLWMETDAGLENAASPLEYKAVFDAAVTKAKPMAEQYNLVVGDEE